MKLLPNHSWMKWALLVALAICTECKAGETVVLLQAASVSRESIRLSDILPTEASTAMRRAGEQIDLGRAPQCHSIRVFERSEIERTISESPLLGMLRVLGPVSVQRECFPIRREAVQQVVSEFVQEKDLALPEASARWSEVIDATKENPALEIEQAVPDPVRSVLQLRLRCMEPTVCPDFWVSVLIKQRPHVSSPATISSKATLAASGNTALVKPGQRAALIFENSVLRIQLPVTCLQRGSLGNQVRAMDPSTHRVFQAEVTGAGILRAHL
ncbi:MAG: flagella basal body P-ring formation protein FlgA [Terriglobales bacterium]